MSTITTTNSSKKAIKPQYLWLGVGIASFVVAGIVILGVNVHVNKRRRDKKKKEEQLHQRMPEHGPAPAATGSMKGSTARPALLYHWRLNSEGFQDTDTTTTSMFEFFDADMGRLQTACALSDCTFNVFDAPLADVVQSITSSGYTVMLDGEKEVKVLPMRDVRTVRVLHLYLAQTSDPNALEIHQGTVELVAAPSPHNVRISIMRFRVNGSTNADRILVADPQKDMATCVVATQLPASEEPHTSGGGGGGKKKKKSRRSGVLDPRDPSFYESPTATEEEDENVQEQNEATGQPWLDQNTRKKTGRRAPLAHEVQPGQIDNWKDDRNLPMHGGQQGMLAGENYSQNTRINDATEPSFDDK